MDFFSVNKLLGSGSVENQFVAVRGWLRSKRDSKAGISFLSLHDGSCFNSIQVVAPKSLNNYESEVLKLTSGCAIEVFGNLVSSQGGEQTLEIQATQINVVGWVQNPDKYPIAKKRHSFEFLRTQAHLRPRTNTFTAITRLRNALANAIHNYFFENHFYWINTPIITSSDCEGAGELFRVSTLDSIVRSQSDEGKVDFSNDFFGEETFLTVSGQLEVEAYCLAMSKVYTFGPTFRAENSNTSRHLAEFWMVEPEVAFANLQDNIDLAESFLKSILSKIFSECEQELHFFNKRINSDVIDRITNLINKDFERIEYSEAIKILATSKESFEFPVVWGEDLATEHERYLAERYIRGPVVILNYPKEIKAFYMRLNDDDKTVAAMDILVPGIGEIIGGSQREERLDILDNRMDKHLVERLWWYRDLRRYGSVPHSGFGLGFERLLNYVTGMENIRDAIPYPRYPGHAEF